MEEIVRTGVSIDSRTIKPGELFVAIKGDTYDGHDYIDEVLRKGAGAVIVDRPLDSVCHASIPSAIVPDTKQALMDLALAWRLRFHLPIVAITGSAGKTSTRALLQSVLSLSGSTLATEKNYNNTIGVPLTLLRLRETHRYAVIEIGTNYRGEIAKTVNIVKPTVAVITNAGAAHLQGLGDIFGVGIEKGDIFSGLSSEGVAVINADDRFADYWLSLVSSASACCFGVEKKADIRATDITFDAHGRPSFQLWAHQETALVRLALMGKHAVYNALAAAAAAVTLGLSLDRIAHGLSMAQPVGGRLEEHVAARYGEVKIIDDSYNANPSSVHAAIALLKERSGISVLVFGDMAELGPQSAALHQAVGADARASGVHYLFCYGPESRGAAESFGARALHFIDHADLVAALRLFLTKNSEGVTILVKGSRVMGMDKIVDALLEG